MLRTILIVGYAAKPALEAAAHLLSQGFAVVLAPSLEAGLEHLRSGRVDAVLLGSAWTPGDLESFRHQAVLWRVPLASVPALPSPEALRKTLSAVFAR